MKVLGKIGLLLAIFLFLILVWSIYWGLSPKNISLIFNPKKVTPVSPLYYIKVSREYFQSLFVFGDEDLSFWNFTLAQKRLEESQILNEYDLKKSSQSQVKTAEKFQETGIYHLNNLIDKIDVNFLIKLRDDNQKEIEQLK